ncbi:ipis-1 isoform X3 [Anabrus simplex]|uniref:ipis-1 isoform X3 n=1 Tax=Anabrus simplex TaxID=316456 RepID=UPI0035A3885F
MQYSALLFTAVLFGIQLSTINSDDSAEREVALNAAVQGINTFSTSLYKVLSATPGNLVVSPFSVEAVVAMLLQGLRGETATQVSGALHLPEDRLQVAQGFKALFQSLQNTDNVTLEIANKIYVQHGFSIKDEYRQSTEQYFMSVAEEVDIAGDAENVRLSINRWAAEKTHDKIQDLLPKGSLTDVVMVLLNAIYFKGLWVNSFDKDSTRDGVFHLTSTSTKNVPMMHITASLMHADLHEHDLQILKLPYQGGKHSMLILLPNNIDGLQQLESNINNLDFSLIRNSLWEKKVDVTLPRFKILSSIDLNPPLQQLGMGILFNGGGNFSGLTDTAVTVSKAIQKAFIEVNEEGTEAAAVTAILVAIESLDYEPLSVSFTADHPFVYMIVDEDHGTILFMGRVVEPTN